MNDLCMPWPTLTISHELLGVTMHAVSLGWSYRYLAIYLVGSLIVLGISVLFHVADLLKDL